MSSGKAALGLLAGVAIGATLGILFAPDKGSVTRSKLSKKGEDLAGDLKNKFNEYTGSMKTEATKKESV
jgi:gas vesicle protein